MFFFIIIILWKWMESRLIFLPLCVCYRATLLCEWAASWINHRLSTAAYWWELHTIALPDTHYISITCLILYLSVYSSFPDGYSPPELSVLLQSLSLLLFLVPVVAVAVGVLLWRRGPCTFPQSESCRLSFFFFSFFFSEYCQLTLTGQDEYWKIGRDR